MKATLDISHLYHSFEQEAIANIMDRARIGALAIESVNLRQVLSSRPRCENESAEDPPCYASPEPIAREEWCTACKLREEFQANNEKARRRLRDAVKKYVKERV